MSYKIGVKLSDKTVLLVDSTQNLPDAYTSIGTVTHASTGDSISGAEGFGVNHAIIEHVRHLINKRSNADASQSAMFPNNITDLDNYEVLMAPLTVNIGPDISLGVGKSYQIIPSYTPNGVSAISGTVSYSSATPAAATVSATGVVTGVAGGSSVITVTVNVGGISVTGTMTATVS